MLDNSWLSAFHYRSLRAVASAMSAGVCLSVSIKILLPFIKIKAPCFIARYWPRSAAASSPLHHWHSHLHLVAWEAKLCVNVQRQQRSRAAWIRHQQLSDIRMLYDKWASYLKFPAATTRWWGAQQSWWWAAAVSGRNNTLTASVCWWRVGVEIFGYACRL